MYKKHLISAIVLLLVVFAGLFAYRHLSKTEKAVAPVITSNEVTAPVETPVTVDTVKIAVLDTGNVTANPMRGCDRLVLVDQDITPTATPLTAALEKLFSIESEDVDGWFNYIDRTNDTLTFDSVSVASGVASVYLSGSATGFAGVCDDPRPRIQIEETALQFDTVDSVQIYLNGALDDLAPDLT